MAELKVLFIGAHLDDNDFCGGGTALKYLERGHRVRFLSMCNGCGGHHVLRAEEIARRRYEEAQAVAELTGIEYDIWDINDCELMADLETRKKLIRYIREYAPDIIFTHRYSCGLAINRRLVRRTSTRLIANPRNIRQFF